MNTERDGAADRTEWAEKRTNLAEDRTVLANERTFAGWMRTGMACIAIALGLRAIFGDTDLAYAPARITATVFVFASVVIFVLAWRKSCDTLRRMSVHAVQPLPRRTATIVTVILCIGAIAIGALLWLI